MPVTINGTTGIDTVTTSAVLTATSNLTAGSVGTYGYALRVSGTAVAVSVGGTVTGSQFQFASSFATTDSVALSGTWRVMGYIGPFTGAGDERATTLLLRIA